MNHHQFRRNHPNKPVQEPAPIKPRLSVHNTSLFTPPADAVAHRAYQRYVSEGAAPGHDVEHWLTAETELIAEHRIA